MILCLAYVVDDGLKAFLVVDIECASTLSPPFLTNRRGRGIMCGEWTETFLLQRLEPAGAPGFELLPDLLGFAVARHDDVKVEVASSAQMTNLATGLTVWTKAVSEVGDVNKRDVPAVVSEMNRTMERAIRKLLSPMPVDVASGPTAAERN